LPHEQLIRNTELKKLHRNVYALFEAFLFEKAHKHYGKALIFYFFF